jgi:hypothetical protein
VVEEMDRAELVATCWIGYVEARAAFARRLSPGERRRAHADLDRDWSRYLKIEVTEPLIRDAAAPSPTSFDSEGMTPYTWPPPEYCARGESGQSPSAHGTANNGTPRRATGSSC